MIIRKKNIEEQKPQKESSSQAPKSSVIKKEDVILNSENIKDTNENKESITPTKLPETKIDETQEFEKIDISSIEFKERVERRRGDRRRGYRRIDERSLVSRAQAEAHSIKELAAREGYQNGLKKAQKEIDEIKSALVEFLSMRDEMHEEFSSHVMEIALEVAKKIIKQEVSMSKDILKNIISSTMSEVNSDAQKVVVKVHPDDAEFAAASLPDIIKEQRLNASVSVGPDETIEIGSCMVIANNGVIDASFKTQLGILQSAFGIYKGGL